MAIALFSHGLGTHTTGGKSVVRRMMDSIVGGGTKHAAMASHGVHAVRQYGESVLVGAALGAINAEFAEGLDPHGVPIDLCVAGLGAVGSLALASGHVSPSGEELAADARNMGAAGATIYAFRKVDRLLRTKRGAISGEFSGEYNDGEEDPIITAARNL